MTDWKTIELGQVCTLQRGMDLPKRMRTDGDFPLVTSSGIDGTHSIGPVEGPGVITGRYGTIGKVFFVESNFWPLNTTLYVRDFHGNDPRFIHYLLKTVDFQSHSGKSGVPGVNRNDVHQEFVHIPADCGEQELIAQTLLDADTLIDSLEQLLIKKRQIRQGVMQELLTGKRRLRQTASWGLLRLGDAATLKARIGWQGLTAAEYREHGDHLLVTGTEFVGGRICWDACHYVDQCRYNQDKNIQLAPGDVLVTKDGTIGKVALIDALPMPATLNSGIFVIRPKDNAFHPGFFYYLLASSAFSSFLGQLSAGSTINHLYQKDFVHFTFRAPMDLDEQRDIFEVMTAIDLEIAAIESRLTKARARKQAMAQALLTGRVRLIKPNA